MLLLALCSAWCCAATPTLTMPHRHRHSAAAQWKEVSRVDAATFSAHAHTSTSTSASATVEAVFALKQSNLTRLKQVFYEVSDPDHPNFMEQLTVEQLRALVAAPAASVARLVAHVRERTLCADHPFEVSPTGDFVVFRLAPLAASRLFGSPVVTLANAGVGLQYDEPLHANQFGYYERQLPAALRAAVDYLSFAPQLQPYWDPQPPATAAPALKLKELRFQVKPVNKAVIIYLPVVCTDGTQPTSYSPPFCASNPLKSVKLAYKVYPANLTALKPTNTTKAPAGAASATLYSPAAAQLKCSQVLTVAMGVFACQATVGGLANYAPVETFGLTYTFQTGAPVTIGSVYLTFYLPSPVATPAFLKSYYGIPPALRATEAGNKVAVVQIQNSTYVAADLKAFLRHFNISGPAPKVKLLGTSKATASALPGGEEGALDIQTVFGIAGTGLTGEWVQLPDLVPGLTAATRLAALTSFAAGTLFSKQSATVYSMSFGSSEAATNQNDVAQYERLDVEFAKAGTLGITFVASSGDTGVLIPPTDNPICALLGLLCKINCSVFTTNFPASFESVTAVGGTQLSRAHNSTCQAKANGCSVAGEVVATSRYGSSITSGGGFSLFTKLPKWQKAVVTKYRQRIAGKIPQKLYSTGGRGVPDLALLAHDFPIFFNKTLQYVDGTSASAPLFAGMVALINDQRLKKGKKTLGFLNQILYKKAAQTPGVFNDITVGDNACGEVSSEAKQCCRYGFPASEGWDATTGLGSVNFEKLSQLLVSLK